MEGKKTIENLNESENIAVILSAANELKVGLWPLGDLKLGPKDVLLESKSNGICGIDIDLWKKGFAADFVVEKPMVLGHEPSALVIDVGSKVKNVKIGDRVAVQPIIPCWTCECCRNGRYNWCPMSFKQSRGLPPMDGCIRKYYTHPSGCCFKFPESMSWNEGAMVEPLSVVINAFKSTQLQVGHKVLICGAGPIGLMAMLCAKTFGAKEVCITDIHSSKLELAKSLGADHTLCISINKFDTKYFVNEIFKIFKSSPDIAIETTGEDSLYSLALSATKNGGMFCAIELKDVKVLKRPINNFSVFKIVNNESFSLKELKQDEYSILKDDFKLAIELIANNKINLKQLVTHRFHIDKAVEAFEILNNNPKGVVKVIVEH